MNDQEKFNPISEYDRRKRKEYEKLPPEKQEREISATHERALLEKNQGFRERAAQEQDEEKRNELLLALDIVESVKAAGGLGLVVGGYARDEALKRFGYGVEPKDLDIEVYGLDFERLKSILSRFGEIDVVGESFGVIKLGGLDISIPRRDSKTGRGHKGFTIEGDPAMTIKEAARRRDFAINSMALDPLTGEIIDPHGGLDDIQNKVLRATDKKFFGDDPLRVLRAMQFAGRFGFSIDPKTVEICRRLNLKELPVERVGEEWTKLLLKSPKPSIGFEVAQELDILKKLHPELNGLMNVPQEPEWHPEGDVWTHTKMVVDCAAEIVRRESLSKEQAYVLMLAAVCHDLGKPSTTKTNEKNRITSHGHSEAGIEPTKSFLASIYVPGDIAKKVTNLVREHLFPALNKDASDTAIRRLATRLHPASIQELVWVAEADHHGRTLPWRGFPEGEEILKKAEVLSVKETKPQSIVMGRDLIDLGLKPSPRFGQILARLYDLQLEGKIVDLEQGKRLAQLFNFLIEARGKHIESVRLLNGELLTKDELISFVEDRFLDEGTHDMGTLTASLVLAGKQLPDGLKRNLEAILTAHKYGPIWFGRFDRNFYENSWKSFYGKFEVDQKLQGEMAKLPYDDQETEALTLVEHPNKEFIKSYDGTFGVKPKESEGRYALYVSDQYPFEAGLMDGFRIMVRYHPEKKRIAVSVLDEDYKKVEEIDGKIRRLLPEFAHAKKIGYLHAADDNGQDDVFSEEDAKRMYDVLKKGL